MVSIIIPAYNEEKRLKSSLPQLASFLQNFEGVVEVIVVDDGSTDNTAQVAQKFQNETTNLRVIKLKKNFGKGLAVKEGFFAAKGEVVVFTDADFSTPIGEIGKLLEKIALGYDIAIGSRALDRSLIKQHQNFFRENIGRAANMLIRLVAVGGVYDTQCGFKAFKKSSTEAIFRKQTISGFAFDVELLFLARKYNLKIAEIAVLWSNDPSSRVKAFSDTFKSLLDLIRIRLRHAQKSGTLTDKFFYFIHAHQTFVRFVLVGISGTAVDYLTYYFLTRYLHFSPLEANPLSVEAAIIWNFTLNNLWTFSARHAQKRFSKKILAYQITSFGGLMLSQTQILIFTNYLSIYDLLAKALGIPLVAIFNYLINSRWTFKDQTEGKAASPAYIFLIFFLFLVYLSLVYQLSGRLQLFLER